MQYEVMLILSSTLTEEEAKQVLDKVRAVITQNEGKILSDELWAKKKLAYPIGPHKHGTYYRLVVSLEGAVVKTLTQSINLLPTVIRSLILVQPVLTEKQKERRENLSALAKKGAAKALEASRDHDKMSLDEFDSKLDQIIQQEVA